MPGDVPPVATEKEALLGFLVQQRDVVRLTAFGLNDDQARATQSPSALTVGGIIKHLTKVERYWMTIVNRQVAAFGADGREDNFHVSEAEELRRLLDDYEAAAAETDVILGSFDDLGYPVPIPADVPWFPKDVDAWSIRWVILHLIEETARHAGHADIVREAVDGATAFALMAAAEGWPESPWITPWKAPVPDLA
jgi:hypothetical protein